MRLSVILYALFILWVCFMYLYLIRDFEIGYNFVFFLLYGDYEVFFDNKSIYLVLVFEGVKEEIILKIEVVSGW